MPLRRTCAPPCGVVSCGVVSAVLFLVAGLAAPAALAAEIKTPYTRPVLTVGAADAEETGSVVVTLPGSAGWQVVTIERKGRDILHERTGAPRVKARPDGSGEVTIDGLGRGTWLIRFASPEGTMFVLKARVRPGEKVERRLR